MKIAIQAADLDAARVDGTRVYIKNMLNRFGKISPQDDFFIYHKSEFNPELAPSKFSNYKIKKIKFPFFWTQIRFALELTRDNPNILWMPMHNLPLARRKKMKTVVTVHDLAYKIFPDYFPRKDLRELNFLGDYAIKNADKLIAVSESTKKDILKFYPCICENKIKVIHHGFDAKLFQREITSKELNDTLKIYQLKSKRYILYSGAIQPRKNLERLIAAFEICKKETQADTKLVLAGEKAWLWREIFLKAEKSPYKKDIIFTGKLTFGEMAELMSGARLFVFPSLYEGFGIPVLEALAAGIPVVVADNSSLKEVGGEAVEYFNAGDECELAEKMKKVLTDEKLRNAMIVKGAEQIKKFSWEKCAEETLKWIKA